MHRVLFLRYGSGLPCSSRYREEPGRLLPAAARFYARGAPSSQSERAGPRFSDEVSRRELLRWAVRVRVQGHRQEIKAPQRLEQPASEFLDASHAAARRGLAVH